MPNYHLDQSYASGQDNDDSGIGKLRVTSVNNQILGQSFTPSVTASIDKVELYLKKIGSPSGNIWVEIHADAADPSGATQLVASGTIPASSINTSYGFVAFTLNDTQLQANTTYWILLYGDYSYSSTDNIYWGVDTSSPTYNNGQFGRFGNGGAAWESLPTYDGLFNQYRDDISSPSASLSPSASSSPSLSPSSSVSSSISPSSSQSPSASTSPSASRSPSASISPSASSSASLSPSSSVSASTSPSPSAGYTAYTRQASFVLPVADDDLAIHYADQEVTDVATEDGVTVGQKGTQAFMIHQFKKFIEGQTFVEIEFEGHSTLAPSASPVYLQVYNQQTSQWETVDSNRSADEDNDFELEGKIASVGNYKDSHGLMSCRVYQLAI